MFSDVISAANCGLYRSTNPALFPLKSVTECMTTITKSKIILQVAILNPGGGQVANFAATQGTFA